MNDDLGFIYPCAECDGIGGALVDSMTPELVRYAFLARARDLARAVGKRLP